MSRYRFSAPAALLFAFFAATSQAQTTCKCIIGKATKGPIVRVNIDSAVNNYPLLNAAEIDKSLWFEVIEADAETTRVGAILRNVKKVAAPSPAQSLMAVGYAYTAGEYDLVRKKAGALAAARPEPEVAAKAAWYWGQTYRAQGDWDTVTPDHITLLREIVVDAHRSLAELTQIQLTRFAAEGDPQAAKALLAGLSSGEWRIRSGCAGALGRIKHLPAAQKLIELLSDDTTAVRVAAAGALRRIGARQARKKLKHLKKNDPEEQVRNAAETALDDMAGAAPLSYMATVKPAQAHVNGSKARVKPPKLRRGLGWLVSIKKESPQGWARLAHDVYRAAGPFDVSLPAGRYRITLTGILPPDQAIDYLLPIRSVEIDIASEKAKAVELQQSPLKRLQAAELPKHRGWLVIVRGHLGRIRGPQAYPIGDWIQVNHPARNPGAYFADRTAAVAAPLCFVGRMPELPRRYRELPPTFVQCESVAVFDRIDVPTWHGRWRGKALYMYTVKPVGLVGASPEVMAKIQKDWDGKSPTPGGADPDFTRAYTDSIRYLREHRIPTNED